jgi:23S rRNA A2030 N6-methylase RlmJ
VKELVQNWKNSARNRLMAAEKEADPSKRQSLETGAMCMANCAFELEEALKAAAEVSIVNRFNLSGPVDARTQQQIAAAAASGVARAMSRGDV